MSLINEVIRQTRVVVNEGLGKVGIQIVKTSGIEELNSFVIPALAGSMRMPEVLVETGTYLGNTTAGAIHHFREIHTVELSEELYKRAKERFKGVDKITCHHGNSPDVLRQLAPMIDEPAVFFLDAHWSGGITALGEHEVPLLEELDIIMERNQEDVIIIDDLRLIGTSGKTGLRLSREYPLSDYDWRNITKEAILDKVGHPNSVFENADKMIIDLRFKKVA